MNEVMKVMAVVTCLLGPPTVIVGIFRMNFDIITFAHTQKRFLSHCIYYTTYTNGNALYF